MMTRSVSIVLQLSNTSAILGASHLLARMEHSFERSYLHASFAPQRASLNAAALVGCQSLT